MAEGLTDLTVELRSIFANFYKRNILKLSFQKRRDTRSNLLGIDILQAAPWPKANYAEMNRALLSLHHNGYIVYCANTITLKQKLSEVQVSTLRT